MNYLLIPILLMLLLTGCGKTGALYLPEAEQEKSELSNQETNNGSL